jgi:hypothetical protein
MACLGARVLQRKGLWAPKAVRCTEDLEGGSKLVLRLNEQGSSNEHIQNESCVRERRSE